MADGYPTVWSWDVEAKQDGQQTLEAKLYAILSDGKDKTIRKYVNSFSQTITVSVRELTWGEWIKSLSSEIDAVKAVVVSFSGAVVAILGWFGISSFRRKEKVARSHVRKQEQSEAL
jgi:hypothetical protein